LSSSDLVSSQTRRKACNGLCWLPDCCLERAPFGSLLSDPNQLIANTENHGVFSLRTLDMSQYMRLDAAAISALNVLPNPRERPSYSHTHSLSFLPSPLAFLLCFYCRVKSNLNLPLQPTRNTTSLGSSIAARRRWARGS